VGGVGGVGYDTPLGLDALIRTRDGIVGTWSPPPPPANLPLEDPANLGRWSPWVRASLVDFELLSRLGFTSEPAGTTPRRMFVWHAEVPAPAGGPAAPPAPIYQRLVVFSRPRRRIFRRQLPFLHRYADLRPDRAAEILAQLGWQVGFFASIAWLIRTRMKKTIELLAAAFRLANAVHMRLKQALACRRPIEFGPQVQPMILTPAHGTLPSGHATEAFITAIVLWRLVQASGRNPYVSRRYAEQLMRLAARVAINRTVAGVHFPIDSAAGALLGLALGEYFVARAAAPGGANQFRTWRFRGNLFPEDGDFVWRDLFDVAADAQTEQPYATMDPNPRPIDPARQSPILSWLWDEAVAEWS
jgi:membrane-associated phospholipid phosphatase